MKYLKKFNESIDSEEQLHDFCETYLAYLLDGDFELSVIWNGHGHMGKAKDCYNINICKLERGYATGFTWLEVKDYYIPFLHMLNNHYKIMDETESYRRSGSTNEPCISLYNGNRNFCVSIEDVLSGEPLPGRYDDRPLLEITLKVGRLKNITEAVELLKKDDIEHYLAYLIDEDFVVRGIFNGDKYKGVSGKQQSITMYRDVSAEEWDYIYKCGINNKTVIIGFGNKPTKVYDDVTKDITSKLLSNYRCNLLTKYDELAHEAADRLLLSFPKFSKSKIVISFDWLNFTIRLQIILIE